MLEAGSGPLALCLHGFRQRPHRGTCCLADACFHAVAPFTRGDAPTAIPRSALTGRRPDRRRGGAARGPGRWRGRGADRARLGCRDRLRGGGLCPGPVAAAGDPRGAARALDLVLFSDYEQLKRFFYLFMFRDPLGFADAVVARDEMSFLDGLWRDWSPGSSREHLAGVKECLREPANLAAAIGYYGRREQRAAPAVTAQHGPPRSVAWYAGEQQAAGRQVPLSMLYRHGVPTAASGWNWRAAWNAARPRLRMVVIEDVGHFRTWRGRARSTTPSRLGQPLAPLMAAEP